jgi:hypothetical protein
MVSEELIEYWTILSLESHLNENYLITSNLGAISVSWKNPQWVGFNEGDLEIFFRPKVWEILKFE